MTVRDSSGGENTSSTGVTLDNIRKEILNCSGKKKLMLCTNFFDEYRTLSTNQKSKSNITYMSKTINPLVCCFRKHFAGNDEIFLNRVDIDASIHNYGSKHCKGKHAICSLFTHT